MGGRSYCQRHDPSIPGRIVALPTTAQQEAKLGGLAMALAVTRQAAACARMTAGPEIRIAVVPTGV